MNRNSPVLGKLKYLGPAAFVGLILWLDPRKIWEILVNAQPLPILAALALNVPSIGLKALRWKWLLNRSGVDYPFGRSFSAYLTSLLFGLLTPGRIGEFIRVVQVHRDTGADKAKIFPSVLVDRFFDLYVLLVVGGVTFLRFAEVTADREVMILGIIGCSLFVPPLVLRCGVFGRIQSFANRRNLPVWTASILGEFSAMERVMTAPLVIACLAATVASYAVFVVQACLAAGAVALSVGWIDLFLVVSAANLLALIPVSVSGIGVRDAGIVVLLGLLGVDRSLGLAYSMTLLVVLYGGSAVLGLVVWMFGPAAISRPDEIP